MTGPEAKLAQDWGHVGSKIPLPYGPGDGIVGLKKNQEYPIHQKSSNWSPKTPKSVQNDVQTNT